MVLIEFAFKFLFSLIDGLIFWLDAELYDLMLDIASAKVFKQEILMEVSDRVYQLLGLIMLFKLIFSFLTYIINPDEMTDKNKGMGNIIKKILITLILIVITPWGFDQSRNLQEYVIKDKVIEYFVFGQAKPTNASPGYNLMYKVGTLFVAPYKCTDNTCIPNDNKGERCGPDWYKNLPIIEGPSGPLPNLSEIGEGTCAYGLVIKIGDVRMLSKYGQKLYAAREVDGINDEEKIKALMDIGSSARTDRFIGIDIPVEMLAHYQFLISTGTGIFIAYMLIMMCIDVAVRSVKLGFYEMIAPIPIVSYIGMKDGKDTMLNKWFGEVVKTYADLFTRIAGLQLAIFFIDQIFDGNTVDFSNGDGLFNTIFVYLFLLFGALTFAKELPKILEGMGIKFSGGGFNLKKKFTDNMALGKNIWGAGAGAVKAGGGLAANTAMATARGIPALFGSKKAANAFKSRMVASGRTSWERLKAGGAAAIGKEYKPKGDGVRKTARALREQANSEMIFDKEHGNFDFKRTFGKKAADLKDERSKVKTELNYAKMEEARLARIYQDDPSEGNRSQLERFHRITGALQSQYDTIDKQFTEAIEGGIGGERRKELYAAYKRHGDLHPTFDDPAAELNNIINGPANPEESDTIRAIRSSRASFADPLSKAEQEQRRQQAEQQRQEEMQSSLVSGIGDAMRDAMRDVNTGIGSLNTAMTQMGANMEHMGDSLRRMQTEGIKTRESHITSTGETIENNPYGSSPRAVSIAEDYDRAIRDIRNDPNLRDEAEKEDVIRGLELEKMRKISESRRGGDKN